MISLNIDTNFNYNIIGQIIETTKNKDIQTKVVTLYKYIHTKSKWITKGPLRSIKYRDTLYKQLNIIHPDSAQYNMCCTNLKTYNVILNENIREAKILHCEQRFDRYRFNAANTWKATNEIISRHKFSTQCPTSLKHRNKTYTNKIDLIIFLRKQALILLKTCHAQLQIMLLNFSKIRIKMVPVLQKYTRNPYHK